MICGYTLSLHMQFFEMKALRRSVHVAMYKHVPNTIK